MALLPPDFFLIARSNWTSLWLKLERTTWGTLLGEEAGKPPTFLLSNSQEIEGGHQQGHQQGTHHAHHNKDTIIRLCRTT